MSDNLPQSLNELSGDERDELSSWLLRTKTGGQTLQWSSLAANNWTHRQRDGHKYEEPPFDSVHGDTPLCLESKELQEYFDKFAIPSVQFCSLEAPPVAPHYSIPTQRRRRHEALRNDLLTRMFYDGRPREPEARKMPKDAEKEAPSDTEETSTSKKKATEEDDDAAVAKKKPGTRTTGKRKRASTTIFEPGADMYMKKRQIRNATAQATATSDKADGEEKLEMPLPSQCVQELSKSNGAKKDCESDPRPSNRQMEKFAYLLSTNHSLLFVGFGSKRNVLKTFAKRLECDGDVLAIQGYNKEVTIEGILDVFVNQFLEGREPSIKSLEEGRQVGMDERSSRFSTNPVVKRAVAISRQLAATRKRPIFLVLHNVDGVGLRRSLSQQALSALVVCSTVRATGTRAIRLISSVDHVNALGVLWDVTTRANFSWIWHEIHTFKPYYEEIKYGFDDQDFKKSKALASSAKSRKKRGGVSLDKFQHVLKSLAPRISESLQLLASLQLKASTKGDEPVEYTAWRKECTQRMVTPSDAILRQFLEELTDHDIVEKTVDQHSGVERVLIPCSRENLHDIVSLGVAKKGQRD